MSLPILQIKRRKVSPDQDWASGGQPNGLIAGELGFNYYNNTLWIGPENDTTGRGYSIFLNKDTTVTSATWKKGTTTGPYVQLANYDQTGTLVNTVSSTAIPAASDSQSGVVILGSQTFAGPKTFVKYGNTGGITLKECPIDVQNSSGISQFFAGPNGVEVLNFQWRYLYGGQWVDENTSPTQIAHFDNMGNLCWITPEHLIAAAISTGDGLTQDGNIVKHSSSIAAGTISGSSSTGLSFGNTINIPSITYNTSGHITGVTTTSVKLPSISAESANTATAAKLVTAVALSAAGKLTTTTFNGNVGAENTFVYFNGGVPTAASETIGTSSKPVYISSGVITQGSTYAGGTKVTLNNSGKGGSTAKFWAPTAAGTEDKQVLVWDAASSAPVWKTQRDLDSLFEALTFGGENDDGRTLTVTVGGQTKTAVIPSEISGFTTITANSFKGEFEGPLYGNADSATKAGEFTSAAKIKLTGDITGEQSSKHGWEIATTLANSGVTAGTYGPTADGSPGFGGVYKVPKITVDAKGRVTGAATYQITLPSCSTSASSNDTAATMVTGASLSSGGVLTVTKYNGTKGSATAPIYLKAGVPTAGSTYAGGTKVTLNNADKGATVAEIYAPTAGGTAGYILQAVGSTSAPNWVATSTITAGRATADASGNTITSTYETKSDANSKLDTAKAFATSEATRVKNELLNGAGEAYDTLIELGAAIDANGDLISGLNSTVATKANKSIQIIAGAGLTGGGTLEANRTIAHSNSVTARTAKTQATATPGYGGSFTITEPKYDAQGHATGVLQSTITLPNLGTVADDDIVLLTVAKSTDGNSLNFSAAHEKMFGGPEGINDAHEVSYTSANATTSISGYGGSGTIKIPQIKVDNYGHVMAAADEDVTITIPKLGNNDTAPTKGGVIYANSTSSYASTTAGSSGQVLRSGGTGAPTWHTPTSTNTASAMVIRDASGNFAAGTITANLTGNATSADKVNAALTINNTTFDGSKAVNVGTIGVGYGGTGTATAPKQGGIIYGSSTSAYGCIDAGSSGQVLMSGGTSAPTWHTPTSTNTASRIVQRDASGNFSAGTITATLSGNASTATAFSAAKSVTLTGDVTGTASSTAGWSVATTLANSGVTAGSYGNSASAAPGHTGTFKVPYITVDAKGRVTSATSVTITLPSDNNTDTKVKQTAYSTSANLPILTCTTASPTSGSAYETYYDTGVYINHNTKALTATKIYGAVWNDYAEYRAQYEEIEPGYCVVSSNSGKVSKTTKKLQACDGIVSDTFGFGIGETDDSKTPLAVAGRVLAYAENPESLNSGDTVCAGPNGKVVKMTREEIREWPDRIVGIVSEIPDYETWGSGNVKVNGRVWIKIR